MLKLFFSILCLLPFYVQAKDYRVQLHVKNLPGDARPVLLRIYNGNMFLLDSLPTITQGTVDFRIPENTTPGMLRAVLGMPPFSQYTQKQPIALNLLFNRENVELAIDYNDLSQVEVIQSEENRIYFDFLKADAPFFRKLGLLEQVVINYPDSDDFYLKALEYYKKFQLQREKFIDRTYASHRNTLAGKIIKNQKIPISEGAMTPAQRDSLFRADFLTTVDFNDTLLLYTNLYTDKAFQYIQMAIQREASPRENEANCIQALDRLVPHLDANPIIQQHILQFLIAGFEAMKMEEVLAHISSNYLQQCGGSADIIKRRLEGYSKMAIGQKVPDFTLTDTTGQPVNLYSQIHPYTLLLFWHTECGHCQILMQTLPKLSQQNLFQQHQVKIIGISIDENKTEWEKFSQNYRLDWINTHAEGGFESDIANDYNLFATPTMFLLDENYQIIAKPTTVSELEKNISELN